MLDSRDSEPGPRERLSAGRGGVELLPAALSRLLLSLPRPSARGTSLPANAETVHPAPCSSRCCGIYFTPSINTAIGSRIEPALCAPVDRAPYRARGLPWKPGSPIEIRVVAAPRSYNWAGLARESIPGVRACATPRPGRGVCRGMAGARAWQARGRSDATAVNAGNWEVLCPRGAQHLSSELGVGTCGGGLARYPAIAVETDSRDVRWWPREILTSGRSSHYWQSRPSLGRRLAVNIAVPMLWSWQRVEPENLVQPEAP